MIDVIYTLLESPMKGDSNFFSFLSFLIYCSICYAKYYLFESIVDNTYKIYITNNTFTLNNKEVNIITDIPYKDGEYIISSAQLSNNYMSLIGLANIDGRYTYRYINNQNDTGFITVTIYSKSPIELLHTTKPISIIKF